MKKFIEIIGIIVGICIVIAAIVSDIPRSVAIALSTAGGGIFGLSVMMQYMKWIKKDKKAAREINDERNRLIQQRAGATTNGVSFVFLAVAVVLFIALEYYIPAVVIGAIYVIQLIVFNVVALKLQKIL